MKFVSKNMNLRVVLRHGVPSEPMSGRNAVPGLYVKFESGMADVRDLETYNLMIKHPGFNSDYILVEQEGADPFEDFRKDKEPQHNIAEMKYGQVGKQLGGKPQMTREQKKALRPMAEEMAKEMFAKMAPSLMEDMLKKLVEKKEEETSIQEENAPAAEPTIPEFIEPTDTPPTPPEFIEPEDTVEPPMFTDELDGEDTPEVVDETEDVYNPEIAGPKEDLKPAPKKKATRRKTAKKVK